MAAGVPVLCSNVTSLPEVGGDAVLYFDPRKPVEIVNVIDRLVQEPGLRASLAAKGIQQSRTFEGPKRMAQEYLAIFSKVMHRPKLKSKIKVLWYLSMILGTAKHS